MAFFQKIKNKLGIGGIKVSIDMPEEISKEAGVAKGKFTLTTKSDQAVKTIKVNLVEKYTTGRGEDKITKEFIVGSQKFDESFAIKPSEHRVFEFDFTFEISKSSQDILLEIGGELGKIGSLGKFANNKKSEFVLEVSIDVTSAPINPYEVIDVKLV